MCSMGGTVLASDGLTVGADTLVYKTEAIFEVITFIALSAAFSTIDGTGWTHCILPILAGAGVLDTLVLDEMVTRITEEAANLAVFTAPCAGLRHSILAGALIHDA